MDDKKSSFSDDIGIIDIERPLPNQPAKTRRTLLNIRKEEMNTKNALKLLPKLCIRCSVHIFGMLYLL